MMKHYDILRRVRVVLLPLLFASAGCSDTVGDVVPESVMVNLQINVAASDIASPRTRAGYEEAQSDDERMRTLRIVVVRSDGTIEHNRFLRLTSAVERYGDETFRVYGREKKRIYLFANELTSRVGVDGVSHPLIDFDLGSLAVGTEFPAERVEGLTLSLQSASEQIVGALPMSECHTVEVPDSDCSCDLTITRAAVKFSFLMTNRSGREVSLTGLSIDKMSRAEYLLPHNVERDENGDIVDYDVPAAGVNNGYYTFSLGGGLPVKLARNVQKRLAPIYLLEGRYVDTSGDKRNYSMKILVDGAECGDYFADLSTLPRNTHVVVRIGISDTDVEWKVDLLPYGEVKLDPSFGLN